MVLIARVLACSAVCSTATECPVRRVPLAICDAYYIVYINEFLHRYIVLSCCTVN